MKTSTVFLEVLGYTMSAVLLFLLARVAVPYFLSQPSTLCVATGYFCLLVVFAGAVTLLVTLIQPLLTKKDASS